jgi:tetratricopeptide (TPR) repeat protein
LNDALQQDSNFIWAYVSLGELHAQQGSPKLALQLADQALQRNPGFLPAMLLQTSAYMQMGDFGKALVKLESLALKQPKNPVVLERLAMANVGQQRYAPAEQQLETALEVRPDYVAALADLVRLYSAEKKTDQIIARIQQQIQNAPKQSGFFEMLGESYRGKSDLKNAELAFDKALDLNPDSTFARAQLAQLYASEGKLPEAIENAKRTLQSHPDFLGGYLLLGTLYQQTGAVAEAEQAYEDALQRNADFAPALNNLAWLLCENGGNLDMALGLAQRAKARLPTDASVADTLAWIQYRKGLYTSAAATFEDISRQAPQNATYHYHLGMTLVKAGKQTEAQSELQRALELQLTANSALQARSVLAQLTGNAP